MYTGNTIYLLFLFAFLFLPLNIANIPKMLRFFKHWRWVLPIGLMIFVVYLLTFQSTHPFNQTQLDYFFRNQLLLTVTHDLALKSVFFIPVAWSLLSIAVTKLRQKNFYWLYPFTVLSLLPIWLIEPRYSFVPFSLFLLFKEESSPLVEWLTIALYIIVGVLLLPPLEGASCFSHPMASRKQQQTEVSLLEGKKGVPRGDRSVVKKADSVIKTTEGAYTFVVNNQENDAYKADLAFFIFPGKKGERTKKYAAVALSPHSTVRFKFILPEGIFWDDEEYFSGKIENSDRMTKFNQKTGFVWKEIKDE